MSRSADEKAFKGDDLENVLRAVALKYKSIESDRSKGHLDVLEATLEMTGSVGGVSTTLVADDVQEVP